MIALRLYSASTFDLQLYGGTGFLDWYNKLCEKENVISPTRSFSGFERIVELGDFPDKETKALQDFLDAHQNRVSGNTSLNVHTLRLIVDWYAAVDSPKYNYGPHPLVGRSTTPARLAGSLMGYVGSCNVHVIQC